MSHIIVAFSKRENAANIRNILMRSGMDVSAVCTTGAAVLQNADTWNEGIVICGCQMQDRAASGAVRDASCGAAGPLDGHGAS